MATFPTNEDGEIVDTEDLWRPTRPPQVWTPYPDNVPVLE